MVTAISHTNVKVTTMPNKDNKKKPKQDKNKKNGAPAQTPSKQGDQQSGQKDGKKR